MSLPILQTKLYVPRHQRQKNVIRRPRLTEKLTAGLEGRVTLISAPAGFGKSTLLSEWITGRQVPTESGAGTSPIAGEAPLLSPTHITWLTLDSDDNDPTRFLTYLIASLQKFGKEVGDVAWTLLQSPQPPAAKTILTILLNDLSLLVDEDTQPRPFYVFILEDYHVIAAQPIHEMLTFLIDHLPPHLHVIITTRRSNSAICKVACA
ncbi:MAG: hypothetical protein IPK16_14385 [Anaerolineales bacterium]|nr:hypothetical protein [Anaerolineales bacterium]